MGRWPMLVYGRAFGAGKSWEIDRQRPALLVVIDSRYIGLIFLVPWSKILTHLTSPDEHLRQDMESSPTERMERLQALAESCGIKVYEWRCQLRELT